MTSPDVPARPSEPPLFRRSPDDGRPEQLFDVHVNLGVTDTAGIGYGRLQPAEYQSFMDRSGIARACVFPPLMADYHTANLELRDWALDNEPRALVFARLGGADGPRPVRRFWQARQALGARLKGTAASVPDLEGFAGVKMIPHLSGLPGDETMRAINAAKLPVLIHAGAHSTPSWIEKTVIPRLRGPVILAHLGAYPTEAGLLTDAVDLARRNARVYLDTSGVWVSEFLRYAAQRVPEKMLFGSDAPLAHPDVAWLQLASAIRCDKTLDAIGWTNAAALFNLPDQIAR